MDGHRGQGGRGPFLGRSQIERDAVVGRRGGEDTLFHFEGPPPYAPGVRTPILLAAKLH